MTINLPFYARLSFILISLIAITFSVYIAQGIITPLVMAILFSVLLNPVVVFLKIKLKFPHVIASITTVLLFVILIVGIFTFISFQISDMVSDFDKIQENIQIHFKNMQYYIKQHFNISNREQQEYIQSATNDTMEKGKEILGTTLMSFTDTLLNLTLIPIYIFLLLLYRNHFMLFFTKLFKKENHTQVHEIINHIKVAVKSYIIGLILEMIAVSILTSIGFMIIGVQYAILLGIITGILNLIPYIGILFAGLLSIVASLSGSPDLSVIFGVIIVNIIVQLIDNNILMPIIVNSKVQINALVSIVGIIIGGALIGVTGMFLAIPIIAIIKVIFDRVESLEPWGYLFGDDIPKTYQWRKINLPQFDFGDDDEK
jgi:predicted PurR-regulated permease PerM